MPSAPAASNDQSRMKPTTLAYIKIAVFVLCLVPLARTGLLIAFGHKVNPIEFLIRSLGTWTLVMLLITLAITPLRRLTGRNELIKLRRMLGLFAFFYVSLHFVVYLWLDKELALAAILKDIIKRPFITVGFAAFVLLVPLAVTSNDAMLRKLKRNWGKLHQLVYPIGVLGVLHYWWLVKKDHTQPLIYALVLGGLLGIRLWWRWQSRRRSVSMAG